MPKYQYVTKSKIIAFDSDTKKLLVYKPVEIEINQLSKEELEGLMSVIKNEKENVK
jgi:hypothetical protein